MSWPVAFLLAALAWAGVALVWVLLRAATDQTALWLAGRAVGDVYLERVPPDEM